MGERMSNRPVLQVLTSSNPSSVFHPISMIYSNHNVPENALTSTDMATNVVRVF